MKKTLRYIVFTLVLLVFGVAVSLISYQKSQAVNQQRIPECIADRCPQYSSMDVDKDNIPETVILVPTAMTQGAGKVLVVDKGDVVFESEEEMQIGMEPVKDSDGFVLTFSRDITSSKKERVRYKFEDGHFLKDDTRLSP